MGAACPHRQTSHRTSCSPPMRMSASWSPAFWRCAAQAPPAQWENAESLLLPRCGRSRLAQALRAALAEAGQRAGCSCHVTPHRLRHYAASRTMPRVGVPAAIHRHLNYGDAA